MLITNETAKSQILDEWEWLKDEVHPEDRVTEMADSACPIYHSEIIAEWIELPREYSNRFTEIKSELTSDTTIEDLMLADLYLYYQFVFSSAFYEVIEAKEWEEA
jgi:hypothetical protein